MLLAAAITRADIANYVTTLIYVYVAMLFVYLLVNMVLSFGARPPYSRAFDVVMGFLRDVSEPYLRLFRRFIPAIGSIDLSPMIAIFVLLIVAQVAGSLISG
jgi:YggT family protein